MFLLQLIAMLFSIVFMTAIDIGRRPVISTVDAITASGSCYRLKTYDNRRDRLVLEVVKSSLTLFQHGKYEFEMQGHSFSVVGGKIEDGKLRLAINPHPDNWSGTPEDFNQKPQGFTTSRLHNEEEVRNFLHNLS